MLWKSLTKNPVLIIGLLMVVILWFDLSRRGILPSFSDRFIATSCRSAGVMLEKRMPENWDVQCQDNNMAVTIQSPVKAPPEQLAQVLYRELANDLHFIAQNSLHESLERTLIVRVRVVHPQMEVNAVTEGKELARMASLSEPSSIAQHLKATVQVQDKLTKGEKK